MHEAIVCGDVSSVRVPGDCSTVFLLTLGQSQADHGDLGVVFQSKCICKQTRGQEGHNNPNWPHGPLLCLNLFSLMYNEKKWHHKVYGLLKRVVSDYLQDWMKYLYTALWSFLFYSRFCVHMVLWFILCYDCTVLITFSEQRSLILQMAFWER